MTEMTNQPAHRFTVGGALGFGFEVFRARPGAVLILLGGQTLIYLVLMSVQYGLMGHMARESVAAADAGDMATALTLNMNLSAYSSLFSLLGAPLWLWMEAVWLVLFMSGRFTLWPGWGALIRMTLGFILAFGVYLGGVIVLSIVFGIGAAVLVALHQGGAEAGSLWLVGGGVGLILLLVLLGVLALFTALPAHGVTGRFELGAAIKTAWRNMGRLMLAWLGFAVIYCVGFGASYGLIGLAYLDQVKTLIESLAAQPEDPLIIMRFYAELFPDVRETPLALLLTGAIMLVMSVLMMIARGIGAKLALSMPPPSEKAS